MRGLQAGRRAKSCRIVPQPAIKIAAALEPVADRISLRWKRIDCADHLRPFERAKDYVIAVERRAATDEGLLTQHSSQRFKRLVKGLQAVFAPGLHIFQRLAKPGFPALAEINLIGI